MASVKVFAMNDQHEIPIATATTGILSKLTRSPPHKNNSVSIGSTGAIDATISATGSTPSPAQLRAAWPRTITVPAVNPSAIHNIRTNLVQNIEFDNPPQQPGSDASADTMNFSIPPSMRTPPEGPIVPGKNAGHITGIPDSTGNNVAVPQVPGPGGQNPIKLCQQIQEISSKRIATLRYLRKAHEGRIYWFNTMQLSKDDISKIPSFNTHRLTRRATNYLLLGMSIPAVLDIHPQVQLQNPSSVLAIAQDYLKRLNTLFAEYEIYQQHHPMTGNAASSLSRAKIPKMFKRTAATSKSRKSSGAPVAEIGAPIGHKVSPPAMPEGAHHYSNHHASVDTTVTAITSFSTATTLGGGPITTISETNFASASSFPPPGPADAPNSSLLPNEGPFTHLLTPPLPFTPDYYTVFVTLCDVLIKVYQRIMQLLSNSTICTSQIGEIFTKADARVRKVVISGMAREFENAARENTKREMVGVQQAVLGGLMGS